MDVVVASPKGYGLPDRALQEAKGMEGRVVQVTDPKEAFDGAHVLYTDTWVSMGQEEEEKKRRQLFKGYTIDASAIARADAKAIVMHCLPAVRGDEIDVETMYGDRSAIWDQAENRLHAQKALLRFFARHGR
jgi:ornithine carbamoyltransferase